MKINAVIIDDEVSSRNVLKKLLAEFCPEVEICGEAGNPEKAYQLILEKKPGLVFLDIQMPTGNGFTLLRRFKEIPFDIIFVTSFDQYAINAIRFSALDYLLKPVEVVELKSAVQKALGRSVAKSDSQPYIINLLDNLEEKLTERKIAIHTLDKVKFVNTADISHAEADSNYSLLYLANGEKLSSSKTLKELCEILEDNPDFIRLHKSSLINVNFIREYSKGDTCVITMKDGSAFDVSRRKKQEVLERLRK